MPSKRSLAFTLLNLAARGTECANTNAALSLESARTLDGWTEELNDDDAAILEEDMCIVANWLPPRLMIEMEGWEDAGFEMENEDILRSGEIATGDPEDELRRGVWRPTTPQNQTGR